VKGKTIDYVALTKLAIDYSDAVIQSSPVVNSEILEYTHSKGMKFLNYHDEDTYADAYVEFYDSVFNSD